MFPAVYGVARVTAGVVPWYLAGGSPTPIAAYQAKGAVSLAASYVNLANPGTFNAAPGVAPTWDAVNGWAFAGAQYLTTGVVPDNTYSMLVRFSGATTGGSRCVMGSVGTLGTRFRLLPIHSSGNRFYLYGNNSSASAVGQITTGVMALAQLIGYLDGVSDVTFSAVWSGTPVAIHMGAFNNNGSPSEFWNGNIQAAAIYNTSTGHATWIPAVSSAMALL